MNNKRNRMLLMLVTIFFWYAQYVYVPYQTPYLTGLGIAAASIGTILGAYGLTQMIVRIPLGVMTDKRPNHKLMIAIGAACAGAASLIRASSATEEAFLIANLISGVASSTYISFTVLNSSYYSPEELPKAMGSITAMNNLGMLLGFITGMIVAEVTGIVPLFYMSLAAGVLGLIVSLFIKQEKKPKPQISVKELLLSALKNKRLMIFAVLALIFQMVHMSTAMAFTTQIAKDIGGTNLEIGMCSVIYMAVSIVFAQFVGSKAAKRIGGKILLPISFACLVIYCVFVPSAQTLTDLYILQAVAGFAFGIIFSLCMSSGMVGVPAEKKSTAMGFFQSIYGIGMTVGPIIVGSITDMSGMSYGYYFLAIFAAAAIVIALIAHSKKFIKEV